MNFIPLLSKYKNLKMQNNEKKLIHFSSYDRIFATEAQARFRIPVGEHQKIVKVATLPDEYQNDNDVHVDLGCMYTVFEIAYIPIWTVDKGEIVCFTEKKKIHTTS